VTDIDSITGRVVPTSGLVGLAHVIYALHAFSALAGLAGTMFVVTAFLFGWPSIIAVILNYVKRADARGTYLDSHFRWQLRTFWFAVLWLVVMSVLVVTVIGIPIAIALGIGVGFWVLYRLIRGWMALAGGRALPA